MALFDSLGKYRNTGILIIRLGIGGLFIFHGFPIMAGGVSEWANLGSSMKVIGIHFLPAFWGLMAAATELFGGFLLLLGLFFRPVNLLLCFTMLIAALLHFHKGEGLNGASHAIALGIVCFGLLFIGAGKYSVEGK